MSASPHRHHDQDRAIDAILASCDEDLADDEVAAWLEEYYDHIVGIDIRSQPASPVKLLALGRQLIMAKPSDMASQRSPRFLANLIAHTCTLPNGGAASWSLGGQTKPDRGSPHSQR